MKISYSSFSVQGRELPNQDAILEPLEVGSAFWCAIADGVGGRPNGDRASSLAVDTVKAILHRAEKASMLNAFIEVVDKFDLENSGDDQSKPMATTLTVLNLNGSTAHVGHVGDTRIYHLRNEGILKRTKDQTEVQDLLDRGVINKRQVARYQRKNVLNGYVASGKELSMADTEFQVEIGDRIVLLTDGVYGVVPMKKIRDVSLAAETVQEFSVGLRKAVEIAGVVDDYSALVLSVDG